RLQGAHDIREPEADELHSALLDGAQNEVSLLVHPGPLVTASRSRLRLAAPPSDTMPSRPISSPAASAALQRSAGRMQSTGRPRVRRSVVTAVFAEVRPPRPHQHHAVPR